MKKLSDCCKADVIEKNNEGTFCSDCGMECDEMSLTYEETIKKELGCPEFMALQECCVKGGADSRALSHYFCSFASQIKEAVEKEMVTSALNKSNPDYCSKKLCDKAKEQNSMDNNFITPEERNKPIIMADGTKIEPSYLKGRVMKSNRIAPFIGNRWKKG